jgi:polysaccharide export outer membrane protein
VAVVQWNPAKSEYERWDALGGTFLVSPEGMIGLPVIGKLRVSDKSTSEVAVRIAAELKQKAGLLAAPEVTVEIVEYPPIYVVGAVTTPGSYQFRPDLTVLQALAIAGGRYRPALERLGQQVVMLPAELATIRSDKLRLLGRIARLQAEMSDRAEVRFPTELTADPDGEFVGRVIALERNLLAARVGEMNRQLTTLAELREMYGGEIRALEDKSEGSDQEVEYVQKELDAVGQLVERGIATMSRRSELRRELADIKARRLDEGIQIMRVRQTLSDATRQEVGIRDQHETSVATELQTAEADLARLKAREEAVRQTQLAGAGEASEESFKPWFTIVRQSAGSPREFVASESTPLLPGDVLKVEVGEESGPRAAQAHNLDAPVVPQSPGADNLAAIIGER